MTAGLDTSVRALQAAVLASALMLGVLAGYDPKLAAVGAFALAFVVLVFVDLTIGVCMFAVISFLDVLPVGGVSVTFAKAAGLLLALSWLATLATERRSESDFISAHPVFAYLLVALVAWAGVSVAWAEDPGTAFQSTYRYALNVALVLIVFTAVREPRRANWVVGTFLTGALISAAYGLASPIDPVSPDDISRLGGAGADPNELAASLVAALALAAAVAAGAGRVAGTRLLAAGVILVCAAGILFSFSRTGLVSFAVALVAAVLVGGRWRWGALALLVAMTLGVGTYLATSATPEQRERVTKLDGGTGRSDIWAVGWRMIEDSPTNGVGAGNFPVSSVHYLLEPGPIERSEFIVDTPKVAHNMYLDVWAELGLIGLTLFVTVITFAVACSMRAARLFRKLRDARMELLSRGLCVALVALLASGFFLSEQYSKQLWLLLALGPSLLAIARAQEQARTVTNQDS